MSKFLLSFFAIVILVVTSFGITSRADVLSESEPLTIVSELSTPTPTPTIEPLPTPSPTVSPNEELLKEFKEYKHDSTQLLQFIFLFLCMVFGSCVGIAVGRYIHFV